MSSSIYDILVGMASNQAILREATKKAQPKIKKDFDNKVRKQMVQYYLDTYPPKKYKRIEPSPILLAYQTKSKRINDGTMVRVYVTDTGVDISPYYSSESKYHQGGGTDKWKIMTDIHELTGRQYMSQRYKLRKEYGKDNGEVQGSWILENFERGIHPTTNAWPVRKGVRKMKYTEVFRGNPLNAAERFADQYYHLDTPYQYILAELDKMWEQMF